jgi:nucleoside-diphosphate-sugar epimerase
MKNVLVTGGNGFIGSNLVKYLISHKYDVTILDSQSRPNNIATVIIGDVLDDDYLNKIDNQYDVIFHCAGSASVPNSVKDPKYDFDVNVRGTINMLEYARRTKAKTFILLSSVSVFDTNNDMPLTELSKIKSTSPYGAAKAAAENYCYAYHRTYGLDTRIARIFNTYGKGCERLFIYDMINKLNNAEKEIMMFGTGEQIRDYVYVDDLVEALYLIWKNGKEGEDYNVCSGKPVKLIDIVLNIRKHLIKENINILVEGKKQTGDIEKWYGDNSKIKSLGFIPKTDIENGLSRILNSEDL